MCHCGRPLHYLDQRLQVMVDKLVDSLGEYTNVTVRGRTWKVPRHYIALHGIKTREIHEMGFEEVVPTLN